MMRRAMPALFAALLLVGSSGCCCFWDNVHRLGGGLFCNGCGSGFSGCGAACGGCGDSCEGGCGGNCGDSCDGGCGGKISGGPYHHGFPYRSGHCKMEGALGCFDWGWGCNNKCSIFGCSSHYLDPNGACYGAYCGNCCEKAGCGPMYWGDAFNVPRTTEPCDCCANFVGPSHSPHGSTPWYYGPPKGHHAAGAPHPVPLGPGEEIVEEHVVGEKTATGKAVAQTPAAAPAKNTALTGRPVQRKR